MVKNKPRSYRENRQRKIQRDGLTTCFHKDENKDEEAQANYLIELLHIYNSENVFGAFVFTFILENNIYDDDPKYDLDMASFGIVKALKNNKAGYKNLPWLPKLAFFELGKYYADHLLHPESK